MASGCNSLLTFQAPSAFRNECSVVIKLPALENSLVFGPVLAKRMLVWKVFSLNSSSTCEPFCVGILSGFLKSMKGSQGLGGSDPSSVTPQEIEFTPDLLSILLLLGSSSLIKTAISNVTLFVRRFSFS